jgi:ankyrin repeat protein
MNDPPVGMRNDFWDAIERLDEQSALTHLRQTSTVAVSLLMKANRPLLHIAIAREMFQVVRELLRVGADPNVQDESGTTALHIVRSADSAWLIGELCLIGANPNIQDSNGWTPLHHNVVRDQPQLISALIAAGASPELTAGETQQRPLHYAINMQRMACAHALLAGGANANAPTFSGMTPLMSLATSGQEEWVTLLLKYGAEVDQRFPEDGMTALMTAARCGYPNVITLLREAGASVSLTDWSGRTAIDYADEVTDPLQKDHVIKALIGDN